MGTLICGIDDTPVFGGLLVVFSRVIGKRVIGANAYMLGEVTGADVDTEK